MKKLFMILVFSIFLAACGSTPYSLGTPTPTPNPGDLALSMLQQQVAANATEQVIELHFAATAQIVGATATAEQARVYGLQTEQARVDAQATANQQLVFAQATQQRIDSDARATQQRIDADATQAQARRDVEATQSQAKLDVQSTQEAQVMATTGAMTQMVLPMHNAWTQQAVEQSILLATNQVELSNLEVKQQQQTNTLDWFVPFSIALALTVAGVLYVVRYSRAREFKNEDGDIEVIVFDGEKAVKPALFTHPVLMLKEMTMPQLAAPAEQSRVTERAQAIKALSVMPVQTTTSGAAAFNKYFSPEREKPYDIIDAESTPPAGLLDSEAMKSIDNDWKEATDG